MRLGHAKKGRLSEMLRRGLVLVVAFMMIFSGLMTAEPLEVLADDREEAPKTEAAQASSQENDPAQEETAEKSEESEKASAEAETEKAEGELTDANTDAADAAEAKEEAAEEKKDEYPASDGEVTWENRKAKVTVSYDENVFPADTKLDVKVLSKKEAIKIVEKAKNDKETADAYAIDITFTGTVDGKKVKNLQPKNKAGVRVEVSFKDRKVEGESYTVYHEDSKTGKVEAVKNAKANAKGMTFTAGSFSIYAVDGEEAQKRASVQYMDYLGRLCSTKIVTVGGQLTSPAATGSPYDEKVFDHWEIRTADQQEGKGTALTTDNFLYKTLDEETLDSLCALGTEGDNNLYSMKAYPVYRAAQRVFVRQYPYGEGGNNEAAVIDTMATKDYGDDKGQTVRMEDVSYALPPEMNNGEYTLIGWEERDPNGEVAATYDKNQEINHITGNKTLYPKIISTRLVILDGNGGPDVPDTFAVYDEASDAYKLDTQKLPTEESLGAGYRQGYTLEGWYTDSACTAPATDGMKVSKDKNNPTTLYAKWAPQDVSYTVIHWVEGPEGGPGEGVYTKHATAIVKGQAGSTITLNEAAAGYTITGYHLPANDELGDGFSNNDTINAIIAGDGSTIVNVYWNRDFCAPTFQDGADVVALSMDTKYDGFVKWGESLEIIDPDQSLRSHATTADGTYRGFHLYGNINQYYITDKTEIFSNFGFSNRASASFKIVKKRIAKELSYLAMLESEGDGNETPFSRKTVEGKDLSFAIGENRYEWSATPDPTYVGWADSNNSSFTGYIFAGYLASDGTSIVPTLKQASGDYRRLPLHECSDSSIYGGLAGVTYYVKAYYDFTIENTSGADAEPDDKKWNLKYMSPLASYNPDFVVGETTRKLGQKEYTFLGWYSDSVAAQQVRSDTVEQYKADEFDFATATMPAGDLTVYASWAPVMTKYTLDANAPDGATAKFKDGSTKIEDNPIEIGDKVTTTDAYEEPTCVGDDGTEYTFLGWYKDPNFESKWYPDQDVVTDKYGQTLYARWAKGVAETYQVIYHDLSGEVIPDDAASSDGKARQDTNGYANGSTANMFGDPKFDDAPEGSAFVGWSTVEDDSSKVVGSIKIGEDKFTLADGSADPNNPNTEKKQYHLYPIYRTEEQLKEEDKARAPKVTFHSGSESYPGKKFATPDTDVTFEKQPDITNGEMKMLMPEDFEGVEYYGHIITGWTEAKENAGTRYRTGQTVGVSDNLDLWAVWEARVDTDGDGKPDTTVSTPDPTASNPDGSIEDDKGKPIYPVDADGDGKPDYFVNGEDKNGDKGDGVIEGPGGNLYSPKDLDGDGTPDVYYQKDKPEEDGSFTDPEGKPAIPVDSGKGPDGIDDKADTTVSNVTPNGDGTYSGPDGTKYYPKDVDGDGKPDFYQPGTPDQDTGLFTDPEGAQRIPVDNDGDGKIDTNVPVKSGPDDDGSYTGTDDRKYYPVDTDGDGKIDCYVPGEDKDPTDGSIEGTNNKGNPTGKTYSPVDTDGDGKPDYYVPKKDPEDDGSFTDPEGDSAIPVDREDSDGDGKDDRKADDTQKAEDKDGDGVFDDKDGNKYSPVDVDGDGRPDYFQPETDPKDDGTFTDPYGRPAISVGPDVNGKANNTISEVTSNGDGTFTGPDKTIYYPVDKDSDGKPNFFVPVKPDPEKKDASATDPQGRTVIPVDTDGDGDANHTVPATDSEGDGIYTDPDGKNYAPIDQDGDGKPDVYIPAKDLKKDGAFTGPDGKPMIPIDRDGDGKADHSIPVEGPDKHGNYTDADGNLWTDPDGKGVYQRAVLVKADPPVEKVVEGKADAKEEFSFVLVEDKAENPDILKGTGDKGRTSQTAEGRFQKEVTIKGEGRAEYGEFLFTRPGTYAYRIYEVNTGVEGYTYDEAVYTVAYTVSEKDGKMEVERKLLKNDKVVTGEAPAQFTNVYKAKDDTEPADPHKKAIHTGDDPWIMLLGVILLIAAGGLIVIAAKHRRRREE